MATTAMAGALSFGPQRGKGYTVSRYFRHKATLIDLGIADDVRLGPPEVGGSPVPGFVYKAGVTVGGGATIMPRLENTIGWLFHGLLGSYSGSVTNIEDNNNILTNSNLTSGSLAPTSAYPPEARYLVVTLDLDAAQASGSISISGSTSGSVAATESFYIGGLDAGTYYLYTEDAWILVDSITLPAGSGSAMVGYLYGASGSQVFVHEFTFDSSDESKVPWMGFRKHIPRHDGGAATDIGEIYHDCKILGATLTLPNDGPISMRADVLGRTFEFDYAPNAWVYENTYEDFQSIPIGTITSGYVKVKDVNGVWLADLPIVAATVSFANVPLDLRQERVYGDPFIEDVTTVQRVLTFDILVKWNNPDLYAQVLTGTTTGSAWTQTPFTSALEMYAEGQAKIGTSDTYYGLKVEATSVNMGLVGSINLAGNQAVLMRFNGTALDPTSGEYVKFTLTNQAPHYCWPR